MLLPWKPGQHSGKWMLLEEVWRGGKTPPSEGFEVVKLSRAPEDQASNGARRRATQYSKRSRCDNNFLTNRDCLYLAIICPALQDLADAVLD